MVPSSCSCLRFRLLTSSRALVVVGLARSRLARWLLTLFFETQTYRQENAQTPLTKAVWNVV